MTQNKIVEVKQTSIAKGKAQLEDMDTKHITVPRTEVDLIDGRWRMLEVEGERRRDIEVEKMVSASLDAIKATPKTTTQRNIYYSIRGMHPDWKFKGMELKEDKVYSAFVGSIMENVQLYTDLTMQSLGVRASPRGYIKGDGVIYSSMRGRVPLSAMPSLQFDLVDNDASLQSPAHKVVHFEKDAGFEGIATNDMITMLETIVSTSQGYLVESANKFLADCERKGMKLYSVHDADSHGEQMSLMYGMASKSNAYMPSVFYPSPQYVKALGLFPTVARNLGLPAESVGETSKKIFPNLLKIVEEHPDMRQDVDILINDEEQWEFQALNGISPEAPAIYLVEALRAVGDEIKYVPENVKEVLSNQINDRVKNFIPRKINDWVEEWWAKEGGLKEKIVAKAMELLADDINAWQAKASEELQKLDDMDADGLREACKLELCKDPKRYWDSAVNSLMWDMLTTKFNIEAEPEVDLKLEEAKVEQDVEIVEPEVPNAPVTKDDIVDSIEKRIVGRADKREPLVRRIRNALEARLGRPKQSW